MTRQNIIAMNQETPEELLIELTDDGYVVLGAPDEFTDDRRKAVLDVILASPPGLTQEEIAKAHQLSV
jgi:hypothetical protein